MASAISIARVQATFSTNIERRHLLQGLPGTVSLHLLRTEKLTYDL